MTLIDHIRRCNRWNPDNFLPFRLGSVQLGMVTSAVTHRLRDFPELFACHADQVVMTEKWSNPTDRSAALRPVAEKLAADGLVGRLRGEDYRVVANWGEAPVMVMDRAVVPAFGFRAFGLHVNGVVRKPDGPHLWIGKRAADKSIEPGKLDNLVAGGQPAGLSLSANLVKEAAEEAGLPAELALQAKPVGAITYCMEQPHGLKRDTLFLYDLTLPEDFAPRAVDGEMEGFTLMDVASILDLLRQGFSFKFNVALVLIDFMIRFGVLTPENEPDYLALIAGLRTPFD